MDNQTLKALKGSIEKWEEIVAETGEDHNSDDCPLCHIFHPDHIKWDKETDPDPDDYPCLGCPVREATGKGWCEDSPYTEWYKLVRNLTNKIANTPERKQAAQAELDFLKSLLPR